MKTCKYNIYLSGFDINPDLNTRIYFVLGIILSGKNSQTVSTVYTLSDSTQREVNFMK